MVVTKKSILLVVAPEAFAAPVPGYKESVNIAEESRIFPAVHELQPAAILLNHDYLGDHTEKILRRMVFNPFYSKIKIYCYKTKPNTKVDALLKVLGVQQFIYAKDIQLQQKSSPFKALNNLFKLKLSTKLVDAGY